MSTNRSSRLTNINFVCTILIVCLHCRIAPKRIAECYSYYPYLYNLLGALADAAVPTFFAISVFLFFRNYNQGLYLHKLRNRGKSLLIPYFIFSLFSLIVFHSLMFAVKGHDEFTMFQLGREFLMASNDPPIWYVRTLFLFVLLSPIIYMIIKRCQWVVVLLLITLAIVLNVVYRQPYSSLQFWMPVILASSALSVKSGKYRSLMMDGGKFRPLWLTLVALLVFIIMVASVGEEERDSPVYYLYRMAAPFFMIIISDLFYWKPLKMQRFAFFIFMLHFLPKLLTATMHTYPILTLFRICFALAFCIVVGMIMELFVPRTWSVINGGRTNI